jgi:uncharacterized OB-fold protein
MPAHRPLPRLDSVNRPFWTGGAQGELRLMRCADCASFVHPPQPVCRKCLSENVAPEAVAGTGTVATFTVNHQKWRPDMEVPYVIARVAIDGAPGVYLTTNIIGCPPDSVDIGDRVRVTFEQHGEAPNKVWLPLFKKLD